MVDLTKHPPKAARRLPSRLTGARLPQSDRAVDYITTGRWAAG